MHRDTPTTLNLNLVVLICWYLENLAAGSWSVLADSGFRSRESRGSEEMTGFGQGLREFHCLRHHHTILKRP